MIYTDSQNQAINHITGNLQIIACAGSGKTQVISQRIVNILREKADEGITPNNIVAFTFTDKAAGELKNRIHTLCREQLGSDFGLAEMYVGTIHGFCLDMLQTYKHQFLKYTVLSDIQQRLLIDRHSTESGLSELRTEDGDQLRRYRDSKLYQKILSIIREGNINGDILIGHPVQHAMQMYQDLLNRKRYLDYTTILLEAVKALTDDVALKQKMSERVKFLIVDEYQDVNPLQETLITLLNGLGAELCVVGDDDQTIFQWNGSDIDNILSFSARYDTVTKISMGDNFRSSCGVVEAAKRVVERNVKRLPKIIQSREMQSFGNGDLLCLQFENPDEEANWIVNKIKNMRGMPFSQNGEMRGLTWSDCAILLRSVKNSATPIVAALRAEGILYVIRDMNSLFDTPEIQAATGLFYYVNGDIDRNALITHWGTADLGLDEAAIEDAVIWLDGERREWPNRWQRSSCSLQHTYMGFLEHLGLREEDIPSAEGGHLSRGEIVYYNLGKFSQLVTDYEQIHFLSNTDSLYESFAGFLRHQAANYYPEGWEDAGYARPDAVQIMTIHKSKGMEFPIVFIPNLVRNRFPAARIGGRQWHHLIPQEAVVGYERYDGNKEDERRLFYVALTRSRKYLYCTWAPDSSSTRYRLPSEFVNELTSSDYVLTREPDLQMQNRLQPQSSQNEMEVALTFSELKYFFECPYQFKLRFLYGFNPGFHEKIGFGKSLHDALAEIHRRALDSDFLNEDNVPELLDKHLHLPYAWESLRDDMRIQADRALRRYFRENAHILDKIEHAEKNIELKLAEGVVVHGRIDLIRRTDTRQIIVIDFKSSGRAQEEEVSRKQLHIYAMGYKQLTSNGADLLEVYNLDEGVGAVMREVVNEQLLQDTADNVLCAGRDIRNNSLCRLDHCNSCDFKGICRSEP